MIRGTTPTLYFTLPFDTETLEKLYMTISQNDEVVIEKTMEECECKEREVTVKLTQEDTLKLKARYCTAYASMVEIQLRVKTKEGEALASNIERRMIGRILKDGVI